MYYLMFMYVIKQYLGKLLHKLFICKVGNVRQLYSVAYIIIIM